MWLLSAQTQNMVGTTYNTQVRESEAWINIQVVNEGAWDTRKVSLGRGQRKVDFDCLPIVSGVLWLDLEDIKGLEALRSFKYEDPEFGPNSGSCLSHLGSTWYNFFCKILMIIVSFHEIASITRNNAHKSTLPTKKCPANSIHYPLLY